jgi:hypothetical protein
MLKAEHLDKFWQLLAHVDDGEIKTLRTMAQVSPTTHLQSERASGFVVTDDRSG